MEPFVYRAKCSNVVDGDTVDLFVDCGFRQYATLRMRLLGINAPEMNATDPAVRQRALEAKQYVIERLKPAPVSMTDAWPLLVRTHKTDSFGRWLAEVWVTPDAGTLGDAMISLGLATPFVR